MADDIDIRQLCDCVAGGICGAQPRSAITIHRVRLWWSDPHGPRATDTIASPAQLDQWISTGMIVGAWCPTCHDEVVCCPSFAPFLTAQGWDTAQDDDA